MITDVLVDRHRFNPSSTNRRVYIRDEGRWWILLGTHAYHGGSVQRIADGDRHLHGRVQSADERMRRRGILELCRPGFAGLQTATIHLASDDLMGGAVKVPECHRRSGRHCKRWRLECHPSNDNKLGRQSRGSRRNVRRSGYRGGCVGRGCLKCGRRNRRGRRRWGWRWRRRCLGSQWSERYRSRCLDRALLPYILGLRSLHLSRSRSGSNGQDDGGTSRWRVSACRQRVKPRQGARREHEHAKPAQQCPAAQ